MAKQQKPGSGGVEEKKAVIDRINSNQDLFTPEEQQRWLSEAQSLQTGNGGPADVIGQQSRFYRDDFARRLNERAAERARELAERRAKVQAQLEAMQRSPGTIQTTANSALVSQGGILAGGQADPNAAQKLTALATPVTTSLTGA